MATRVPHEVLWLELTVELVLVQKQPGCYDVKEDVFLRLKIYLPLHLCKVLVHRVGTTLKDNKSCVSFFPRV